MGQFKAMRDASCGRRDLIKISSLRTSFSLKAMVAAAAFAAALLSGADAWAQCTPATPAPGPGGAPVSGTTVTCSGTVTNQNNPNGYGTGLETNNTINVQTGATVTGTNNGLAIGDNNIVNIAPTAKITGTISGITPSSATAGTLTVNNQGTVMATSPVSTSAAILSGGAENVNVTNSGTITGVANAIQTTQSFITLNNQSGGVISATGSNQTAILAGMSLRHSLQPPELAAVTPG